MHSRCGADHLAVVVLLGCLTACGGSGGGGQGAGGEFVLEDAFYGRGIETAAGFEVVSPLSTVKVDALTGIMVAGSLQALGPGVQLDETITLGLGSGFKPLVVPRNAVIVLHFTRPVDPDSVVSDEIDPAGAVLQAGSVQVRTQDGLGIPVRLTARGREILIDPVSVDRTGLPASPLVFGLGGEAVADPTGFLRLSLPRNGANVVRTADGSRLQHRSDRLGDPSHPIGFNPGNAELDFIEQNNLFPWTGGFNGFLPDIDPPRVVREYSVDGTLSRPDGDRVSSNSLFLHDATFNTSANAGAGEWADHLLLVRPDAADEERHVVAKNGLQNIVIADQFIRAPVSGETWRLVRSEYFEPDPTDPVDPALFDPENPQNSNNAAFKNFVVFEEIDASGMVADVDDDGRTLYSADDVIPSRAVLKVRFSEPMDRASVLPYESFRVTVIPEPEEAGLERVGLIRPEEGGRVMAYWPARQDPTASGEDEFGGVEYMGFGHEPLGSRLFVLRTVPDVEFLEDYLDADELADFVARGYRGVTDLGGLPLAFASSDFSPTEAQIEYSTSFSFRTIADQRYADVGAIVHRFQGVPQIGVDLDTGESGVRYHDRDGYYGPILSDLNIRVDGVLSPAPVAYFERTLDDVPGDTPPGDSFFAWPLGAGAPLSGSVFKGTLYASIYGVRFQHVYPMGYCSISPMGDLKGSYFDLVRVSFAPIGGNVTHDVYEDISVHAAFTQVIPNSNQFSGLGAAYDTDTYNGSNKPCGNVKPNVPNYIDPLQKMVPSGTTWVIDQSKLFTPRGTTYAYHPWPEFKSQFRYDNASSILLEYRIRPQDTAISYQNGFTFSAARNNSPLPRYRVYSFGSANNILAPDPGNGDPRAKCASGPQPKPQRFGDNSRYFCSFDYVKLFSTIRSPFIEAAGTEEPHYLPAIMSPPASEMPPGTTVSIEFRAAEDPIIFRGKPEDGWTTDPGTLDGLDWIQFRLSIEGNPETLLVPTFESIVMPYYR